MSQLLESESDAASTSSTGESSRFGKASYSVQDGLEQYSKRLSFLGLGSSDDVPALGGNSSGADASSGNIKAEPAPKRSAPVSTSAVLTHLTPAGDQAIKRFTENEGILPEKVQIKFQPIGSVSQVLPQSARISASQPFSVLVTFLRKKLKMNSVYCYVNNSFSPAPQQSVGDLWRHFRVNDELVVSYCGGVAFG
ncbi:Ubiquitin-like protein ATG12 [Lachancea thermotolerans]